MRFIQRPIASWGKSSILILRFLIRRHFLLRLRQYSLISLGNGHIDAAKPWDLARMSVPGRSLSISWGLDETSTD
jgi:hypothetical protein